LSKDRGRKGTGLLDSRATFSQGSPVFFYEEIESEEKTISMINPGLFLITTTELALAVVDATVEQQIHSEF
jgi:hypothetical protein